MRAEGTYDARLPSFAEVRALAEAFGQTAGAGHEATIRVVLVLEELFTNTVAHGYPPGGEGRVWVTLALTGNAIEITYEDVDTSLIAPRPRLYGLVGAEDIEKVWKERVAAREASSNGNGSHVAGKLAAATH